MALAGLIVLAGCSPLMVDVHVLAGDAMGGRDNETEGSARARRYLIDRLDDFAVGVDASAPGDAAFTQAFEGGTNVLALIPGDELPDEYVIIGAHYDHLGTGCDTATPTSTICIGTNDDATDNATGVAAVLAIGEQLARQGRGPSRSVILAFWDREEDGLRGARAWIADPLVPVAQTVAYVNYDIQGANILPTLRTTTFAIGAETGGERLTTAVGRAVRPGSLATLRLSWIFGQGRSDYLPFIQAGVPTIFFSDSTGPCYHTAQDHADIVDYRKLHQQVRDGVRLARDLAGNGAAPAFVPGTPPATYDDAVALREVGDRALPDLDRFDADQQAALLAFNAALADIVAAGPDEFGPDDAGTVLSAAASAVDIFTSGDCDGFTHP
jgi:Peptidase family M28